MSDKPAEHAYHARGAGRVSLTETELEILLAGRFGLGHDLVGNVEILWLTQQLNKLIAAHQGEPSADTGTTPPPDEEALDSMSGDYMQGDLTQLPAMSEMSPYETAWLVERRDRGAIEWLICDDGGFDWTADPLKPIRFCRREDADQVASLFDDIDVHITEHRWGL